MARPGDHTKVVIAATDASGELAVFDASGNLIAGPHLLGAGTIPLVAANPNGTRFATEFVSAGTAQLFLLDASLNPVAPALSISAQALVFSRNGSSLSATHKVSGPPPITVFDG